MKEPRQKKELYIVLVSLIVFLTFNFILHQSTTVRMLKSSSMSFQEEAMDVHHLVENRIARYEEVLTYGKKFFESSSLVTREEFQLFYADIFDREDSVFDAVNLIAYVERVQNKKEFVDSVRAEKTKIPFQFLYFNLNTMEDKSEGLIFNYIIPHSNGSRYFGYDATETPSLKEALLRSGANDTVILTDIIDLFGKEEIFLIKPIYGKRTSNAKLQTASDAVSGYVVLALDPTRLFDSVFASHEMRKTTNFKMSFSEKEEPFYYKNNLELGPSSERLYDSSVIDFGGKKTILTVESSHRGRLSTLERVFPDIVFYGSSAMILGFFIVMINYKMSLEEGEKRDS